ncbi:unnamed protein product, partial [Mesorhabditis belari]|uniref:Cytochrome P450 n=1 Tax=Mesorhabditis belari TaxID=2138241 RepID=A0AAF3J479_9BILA
MIIFVILLILWLFYVLYYYLIYRKRYPKGPLPLPFIGNIYHINPIDFHQYLDKVGLKYGNCFTLFLPAPTVILTDFEYIKEALQTQGQLFSGRTHRIPEILLQRNPNTGIIISDGETWKTQRNATLKIFKRFGVGASLMEEKIQKSIDKMLLELNGESLEQIDLEKSLQLCVGNVINDLLFGFQYTNENASELFHFIAILKTHLKKITSNPCTLLCQSFPWAVNIPLIGYFGYTLHKQNIDKYISFIERQVFSLISSFLETSEPTNLVHAYLKEMKEVNEKLDLENLVAICNDLWLGGMESTATCLRWILAYMIHYPDVQRKAFDEINSLFPIRKLSFVDRNRLPYTQAVLNEIQRHCNMNPFLNFHVCTEETQLFGQRIPKETTVMAQIWSVLRSQEIFEDPFAFRPERFITSRGELNKNLLNKNIVFGIGKRSCAAEGLAKMQLFLIFANLIQKYKICVSGEKPDLKPDFATVLSPKPFFCRLEKRNEE